jgi:hypothetical protein
MEGVRSSRGWRFASPNQAVAAAGERSVLRYLLDLHGWLDEHGPRPVIPLSVGDPSSCPSFRTAPEAVEAVATALRSGEFDGYPSRDTNLAASRSVHPPCSPRLDVAEIYFCCFSRDI